MGGNTKTMMVACLSPADNNYDETLSTLRYANRAKNIKNKPKINEDPKDAMLREYQEEIKKLKAMLDQNPQALTDGSAAGLSEEILEEERKRMRSEHEKEMNEIRKKMESEKQSKAQMQNEIELMKQQYEEKLKDLEERAERAKTAKTVQRQISQGLELGQPGAIQAAAKMAEQQNSSGGVTNQMQQEAMIK